jgi:hypothetical protein
MPVSEATFSFTDAFSVSKNGHLCSFVNDARDGDAVHFAALHDSEINAILYRHVPLKSVTVAIPSVV